MDVKKELAILKKKFALYDEQNELAESLGEHFAKILNKKWPNNTNIWSRAFAAALIKVEDDYGSRHGCRDLLITWMMEYFAGFLVETMVQDIDDVYAKLKSLLFTEKDGLEFNDGDNYAWYIPHRDKLLFVMQSQTRRKLVIVDSKSYYSSIHVRRVWYKYDEDRSNLYNKLHTLKWYKEHGWEPTYGDFRDSGYVFSCSDRLDKKVVEGANLYFHELHHFKFDLDHTQSALLEQQTGRLSKLHHEGKLNNKERLAK